MHLAGAFNTSNLMRLADRKSLAHALLSVAFFMDKVESLAPYSHQFNELASVFYDLECGTVHPILKTKKRSAAQPTARWCARGRVAFAVWLLIRSGKGLDEAINHVAQRYPRLEALQSNGPARGNNLKSSVKHWHELFASKEGKNVRNIEAREMFADITLKIVKDTLSSVEMARIAEHHLQRTSAFLPSRAIRPEEGRL